MRLRNGRRQPRNIYEVLGGHPDDDRLCGQFDRPDIAVAVVQAVNREVGEDGTGEMGHATRTVKAGPVAINVFRPEIHDDMDRVLAMYQEFTGKSREEFGDGVYGYSGCRVILPVASANNPVPSVRLESDHEAEAHPGWCDRTGCREPAVGPFRSMGTVLQLCAIHLAEESQ